MTRRYERTPLTAGHDTFYYGRVDLFVGLPFDNKVRTEATFLVSVGKKYMNRFQRRQSCDFGIMVFYKTPLGVLIIDSGDPY